MAEVAASAVSSAVNRVAAVKLLFSASLSQLRRQLLRLLRLLTSGMVPAVSLPRRPSGAYRTVASAALLAMLMRRVADAKLRARSSEHRRRPLWGERTRGAETYEDWAKAMEMTEEETAGEDGRRSGLYDEVLVRNKLQELRQRRRAGSLRDIVFCLRSELMRNLGNMCNPKLHSGRLQVPKLIGDYIDEVSGQLKVVCESETAELSLDEKLAFVYETRHAFGRTALLLSGGATLTAFHLGVVKVLVDRKLLPRILAGSSAGSIICAIIACKSRAEIESFFMEDSLRTIKFFDQMGGALDVVRRMVHRGAIHEIRQLQRLTMDMTSNMTFQEAYDRTGRVLGVAVCSRRPNEPARCLNYLTSPNVLIWSAVTASCAFPGLFEAQELMAKDMSGAVVPYHAPSDAAVSAAPPSRRWRDGTLESDLPMMQLKELFNVNHFIVSQVNPHISPWLRIKEIAGSYGGDFGGKLANVVEMEVKHRFSQLLELGLPLGGLAKLFTQDWEGDLTVFMPATLAQYSKLVKNPSMADLRAAMDQGSRCTWEKLSAIRATCAVEFALDESAIVLNYKRRERDGNIDRVLATTSEGVLTPRTNTHRPIPSWNSAAGENKPNFVEQDLLADAGSGRLPPPGPNVCSYPPGRAEVGPSRAEGKNELKSKSFANFVRNPDIPGARSASTRTVDDRERGNSRLPPTPTSIILSDGDLLQPGNVGHAFVLNVVKKEAYTKTPKSGSREELSVPPSEAAGECYEQIDGYSSSSGSECSDDDDDE